MIVWAIERCGYSVEDFYLKSPKVKDWVSGQKQPTLKQKLLKKVLHQKI